jgi:hypothetical protein
MLYLDPDRNALGDEGLGRRARMVAIERPPRSWRTRRNITARSFLSQLEQIDAECKRTLPVRARRAVKNGNDYPLVQRRRGRSGPCTAARDA